MTLSLMSSGLLAICLLVSNVHAAFEHYCSDSDYRNRRSNRVNARCGTELADFLLYDLCLRGMNAKKRSEADIFHPQSVADSSLVAADIFHPQSVADSFLKPGKRAGDGMTTGIVCECCLNRCNTREMLEYCDGSRRKRSVRVQRDMPVGDADASRFYEAIDMQTKFESSPPITIEQLMKDPVIQQFERQKELNIQRQSTGNKRLSGEALDDQLGKEERYLQMKEYLKSKLSTMLDEEHPERNLVEMSESGGKSMLERVLEMLEYD